MLEFKDYMCTCMRKNSRISLGETDGVGICKLSMNKTQKWIRIR